MLDTNMRYPIGPRGVQHLPIRLCCKRKGLVGQVDRLLRRDEALKRWGD